ncbi:restriction endonuclease subunit S [Streptococcus pseudopneumoniae]|nr:MULTISPECIES: restriction endonuclease subunit S [Streptococcus]AEL11284.1 hypothetical protein SPPN_09365 [Streptococcus pseudopneumoniae IS7493]NIB76328.1 restriction endonuclease subunit S [Streptococcus pseudopneumoniae]TMR50506.1 restriction endonuclease subunit S [Streptococcus pseudopneumoniae]
MTRMKESGIDWIGQIPEEWEVTRIKNIVSIERGASPRPIDKFISDDDTGVNWIRIGDTYKGNKYITSTKLKITNRGKQFSRYIHPGTLILSNSMSFGEPYISSIYGCIHDGWLSLAPYKNISKEYLYWLLLSDVCTSQFNLVSIGAVVENLSVDKVGNTLVSMPYSLSEQQKIADFLDKKTAQLDKAKALLEEQIQKLKDYRASLIYETVTKGLDKNVPMKDSGVDWIGQIPQGWGVSRLKYLANKIGSGKTPLGGSEIFEETGILFIRSQNIYNGLILLEDKATYINRNIHQQMIGTCVKKNDILLNITGASIGRVAKYDLDIEANVNQHVCIIRCDRFVLPDYLMYFIMSEFGQFMIKIHQISGNREGLSFDNIGNFKIIIPDLDYQYKISQYLNKKC